MFRRPLALLERLGRRLVPRLLPLAIDSCRPGLPPAQKKADDDDLPFLVGSGLGGPTPPHAHFFQYLGPHWSERLGS